MTRKRGSAVHKKDHDGIPVRRTRIRLIAVLCVVAVVAVLALLIYAVFHYLYKMTDYITDVDVTQYKEEDITTLADETLSVELQLEYESIEQQRESIDIEVPGGGYVYNILLIGLDLRSGETWNGNSDSMILLSINYNEKKIVMTSFMRDLYATISGVSSPHKLNYAHALGGGPLLVSTIENMYKIDINNYATVNFYDMISIIDSIGGIDIDVTEEEASVANEYYVPYLAKETGVTASDYYLTSGYVHLNGLQTVAFSRIRYTSGSDYARTERQRRVLSIIFEELKTLSMTELSDFMNAALPCITHNIDESTLATLLASAYGYLDYSLETSRVPYDDHYTIWNELLVPDFEYTIQMLHSQIY